MRRARIAFPIATLLLALLSGIAFRALSRPRFEGGASHDMAVDDKAPRTRLPSLPAEMEPAETLAQAPAPAAEEKPPEVLRPRLHPRDPKEWQGMLVDVAHPQWCEQTQQCGMALTCRNSQCLPCSSASDCGSGEDCVLDHCVKQDKVECRRNAECGGPSKACILSGYSAGPRGNETMKAYCLDTASGQAQTVAEWQARQPKPDGDGRPQVPTSPTTEDDLLGRL